MAYQRASRGSSYISRTTPASPFHQRRVLEKDAGRILASGRGRPVRLLAVSASAPASALNIKTPYMSLVNAPHSTDGIDLHNKRTLHKERERERELHKRTRRIRRGGVRVSCRPVRCASLASS